MVLIVGNTEILAFQFSHIVFTLSTHSTCCVECALQEVQVAIEQFTQYSAVWEKEREAEVLEFISHSPQLSEFELQINFYEQLEQQFMAEADHYNVGPIAIYTG